MTLDEAIERLVEIKGRASFGTRYPYQEAINLGIEALKQIKLIRVTRVLPQGVKLPGETEK